MQFPPSESWDLHCRSARKKRCLSCKELHDYIVSCGILYESSIPLRTVIPLHIVITVISRGSVVRIIPIIIGSSMVISIVFHIVSASCRLQVV